MRVALRASVPAPVPPWRQATGSLRRREKAEGDGGVPGAAIEKGPNEAGNGEALSRCPHAWAMKQAHTVDEPQAEKDPRVATEASP